MISQGVNTRGVRSLASAADHRPQQRRRRYTPQRRPQPSPDAEGFSLVVRNRRNAQVESRPGTNRQVQSPSFHRQSSPLLPTPSMPGAVTNDATITGTNTNLRLPDSVVSQPATVTPASITESFIPVLSGPEPTPPVRVRTWQKGWDVAPIPTNTSYAAPGRQLLNMIL